MRTRRRLSVAVGGAILEHSLIEALIDSIIGFEYVTERPVPDEHE
jgi:hypothetical protein